MGKISLRAPRRALLRIPLTDRHAAQKAQPHSWSPLTPEQTAPYVAFEGAQTTIVAEESAACGQRGCVRRVFWRKAEPWVVLRCQNGPLLSVPWHWTNLPVPLEPPPSQAEYSDPVLLTPQSLVELVRFVRYHAGNPRNLSRGEKGAPHDSPPRQTRISSRLQTQGGDS